MLSDGWSIRICNPLISNSSKAIIGLRRIENPNTRNRRITYPPRRGCKYTFNTCFSFSRSPFHRICYPMVGVSGFVIRSYIIVRRRIMGLIRIRQIILHHLIYVFDEKTGRRVFIDNHGPITFHGNISSIYLCESDTFIPMFHYIQKSSF